MNKGGHHSAATKARIAEAARQRWSDPEFRSRVSRSIRENHPRRRMEPDSFGAIQDEVYWLEAHLPPRLDDVAMLERISGLGRIKLRGLRASGLGDRPTKRESLRTPPLSSDHKVIEDWSDDGEPPKPRPIPSYRSVPTITLAEVQSLKFPVMGGHDHGVDLSQPKWRDGRLVCRECEKRIKIDPKKGIVRHAA